MFFQASKLLKKSTPYAKSIVCSSFQKFSLHRELLFPFSPSRTLNALTITQKTSPRSRSKSIVVLDKLTSTDYSETYRAYDLENKVFVAQKEINLESPASWNQTNLILRQYWRQQSSPLFAQTLSINYDEKKQNVKIITELQNTILKDYCNYLDDRRSGWLQERIRPYITQIIQQLIALKQLGIELKGGAIIDPQKVFIANTFQTLRLYDFSDFAIKDEKSEIDEREFFEIAKQTLMKLMDMNAESREFENDISLILKGDNLKELNQNIVKNTGHIAEGYEQFIFDKLLRVAFDKKSSNFKTLSDTDQSSFGLGLRDVYTSHAETYRSQGDFRSAIKCYEKAIEAEENMRKIETEKLAGNIGPEDTLYKICKPVSLPEFGQELVLKIIVLVLEFFFVIFFFCVGFFLFFLGLLGFAWLIGRVSQKNETEKTPNDSKGKVE